MKMKTANVSPQADNWQTCEHRYGFDCRAYVPAGVVCNQCDTLLCQNVVPPNEPDLIGYVSADWAWHYKHGKPWTSSEPPTVPGVPDRHTVSGERAGHHTASGEGRGYFGSKGGSGVWQTILNQIPAHDVFIEAFAGSAVITKRKRPARSTIVIDKEAAACQLLTSELSREAHTVICGDAISWLEKNREHFNERTCIYCDPPYLFDERKDPRKRYKKEMGDLWLHRDLLAVLSRVTCQGVPVLLSGYRSELYDDALPAPLWRRIDYQTMTRGGLVIESLWCNFPEPAQLHDYSQAGTNWRERERIRKKKRRWLAKLQTMPAIDRAVLLDAIEEYRRRSPETASAAAF